MKKYISIMLLAIVFATTTSKAQMIPAKSSSDGRSPIQYLSDYILDHKDYRDKFVNLVNEGFLAQGLQTTFTENTTVIICSGMHSEYKTIYNFKNHYRKDGKIKYETVANYTGIVWVYDYQGYSVDIVKYDCGNLISVPPTIKQIKNPPVSNNNQNNVTTVYLTAAPAYQQPKTTNFDFKQNIHKDASWGGSVSGSGVNQAINQGAQGNLVGCLVAAAGAVSFHKDGAYDSQTSYTGSSTGYASGFPDISTVNSSGSQNGSGGNGASTWDPFINGRPTWR